MYSRRDICRNLLTPLWGISDVQKTTSSQMPLGCTTWILTNMNPLKPCTTTKKLKSTKKRLIVNFDRFLKKIVFSRHVNHSTKCKISGQVFWSLSIYSYRLLKFAGLAVSNLCLYCKRVNIKKQKDVWWLPQVFTIKCKCAY